MRQIIPISNSPNQTLQVTLEIDNQNLTFILVFRYNEEALCWMMTIIDSITNLIILDSIPLVRGRFEATNILEQYKYLKIGSCYLIKNSGELDYPDDKSLGNDFSLLWSDTPNE